MNPLRFIKRLPVYWNRDRDYQVRVQNGYRHEMICFDEKVRFVCPNDALVFAQFQSSVFESTQRRELRNFLRLAAGCSRLLDAGSSAGIISLIFAASREQGALIAVEPDARSLRLIAEAQQLNARPGFAWTIVPAALSDQPGWVMIDRSEFGATVAGVQPQGKMTRERVEAHSLSSLCSASQFRPDIVKIDIESYEHEVLLAGKEWLADVGPRLQLELHSSLLRRRGLDPLVVLRMLYDLNYSDLSRGRSWAAWASAADERFGRPTTHFWLKRNGERRELA